MRELVGQVYHHQFQVLLFTMLEVEVVGLMDLALDMPLVV
jgi:hypothetical protein